MDSDRNSGRSLRHWRTWIWCLWKKLWKGGCWSTIVLLPVCPFPLHFLHNCFTSLPFLISQLFSLAIFTFSIGWRWRTAIHTPSCIWRRTGEIQKANQEFANLLQIPASMFRNGQLCVYELMDEDSAVRYWEGYGKIAFDAGKPIPVFLSVLKWSEGTNKQAKEVYIQQQPLKSHNPWLVNLIHTRINIIIRPIVHLICPCRLIYQMLEVGLWFRKVIGRSSVVLVLLFGGMLGGFRLLSWGSGSYVFWKCAWVVS